jgi:hypothetical protein
MSASQVQCHVLGGQVSVVADLNGNITNVICPKFDRFAFTCSIKKDSAGFLKQLAGRMADRGLGMKVTACEFANPDDSPSARIAGGVTGDVK